MGEQGGKRGRFVGERIRPVRASVDTSGMAVGEPGLPMKFVWRRREHAVARVLERWKETSDCTHGSAEQYVRKHWFRIKTTAGVEMVLYFERQSRSARQAKSRWWLYSIDPDDGAP
jgi:phosphoribosylglycinamide formyltransferase-1